MLNFRKIKFIFIKILFLFLLGCASNETLYFDSIESEEKTVSVPGGYKGVIGPLKQVLLAEGWELGEYGIKESRYKLIVNTVRAQLLCWNEFSEISYEVFLVDLKKNREIFVISGEDCDDFSKASTALRNAIKKASL